MIAVHESYVVRIDIFADPSMPPISSEELEQASVADTMAALVEQMKHLSTDELQDQVHRRFEYRLCIKCQARFLINPLGKPRHHKPATN